MTNTDPTTAIDRLMDIIDAKVAEYGYADVDIHGIWDHRTGETVRFSSKTIEEAGRLGLLRVSNERTKSILGSKGGAR